VNSVVSNLLMIAVAASVYLISFSLFVAMAVLIAEWIQKGIRS
jgi:hypothetical protein